MLGGYVLDSFVILGICSELPSTKMASVGLGCDEAVTTSGADVSSRIVIKLGIGSKLV